MTLGCVGDNTTVKGHFFLLVCARWALFLLQKSSSPESSEELLENLALVFIREHHTILALTLCPVQSLVGTFVKLVQGRVVSPIEANADTAGDM